MGNEEWLDLVKEEIIDPGLPICDPHHHLWRHPESDYGIDTLLRDTGSGHNIVSTVFVECGQGYRKTGPQSLQPVGENEFVLSEVERATDTHTRVAAGIVGHADLCLGDAVDEVLAAHMEASGRRFRGIRHANAWDASDAIQNAHSQPQPYLLADAKFRQGFARLRDYNLSFDAWLFQSQISELTSLARAFPDTPIVLDHLGGLLFKGPWADQRDQVFARWCEVIAELAALPNVSVKLGGCAMAMNGFDWHKRERPLSSREFADVYGPWYRICIEAFGPERCMFESNFPMDRVSVSYAVLWNAFKRMSADYSEAERAALFHDTAVRVYRL